MVALVALFAATGCGGNSGHADLAPPGLDGSLPTLDELDRETSGYISVTGQEYVRQHGGEIEGTDLVLTYIPPELPGGGSTGGEPDAQLAYAVYAVAAAGEEPLTLEVRVGYDNDAVFWLGFADWQNRTWDFSNGYHYDSVLMGIEDLPGGVEQSVSLEGRIGVALLVLEEQVPLRIHFVEVTTATEIEDFAASTDRWDGIELTWRGDSSADGYMLYRRPAEEPDILWDQLAEDPLSKYLEEFLDGTAAGGVDYEYRLSTGFMRQVEGVPEWFWSDGETAVGKRRASQVGIDAGEYWPVNMYHYLSFFYAPAEAPLAIEALRSTSYPPDDGWVAYDETTPGFGGFELSSLAGFGRPFATHQLEGIDNPAVTLLFSLDSGVVSQVATITPEGDVTWESPTWIREPGQHLLGVVRMPRRIGALTWNPSLSRIELVDSIDMYGRDWYEFEPDDIPWHVVGDRIPDGRVEGRYFGGGERITFREQVTGEIVSYERKGEWQDISPGIVSAPGPTMRMALNGFGLPGFAVIYLAPDGKRIKMVRQDSSGTWLTHEIVDLVIAKGESTISEFALLTGAEISYENYLVYVLDDQLYLRYTEYASFYGLDSPVLVDDAPGIRDLDVLRVGAGENWSSLKFVTYITDGSDGTPVVNYRDMDLARATP